MFKITNFSIKIKDRFLIKDLNLAINPGDKLAIIGEEGNGKSTLLKAIYNKELVKDYAVVSGTILNTNETFGYLEQKLSAIWQNCSVIEFLLKESPKSELDYNLYNQIYKLHPYIKQFDLPGNVLDDNIIISNLSGGEQVKVQIRNYYIINITINFL